MEAHWDENNTFTIFWNIKPFSLLVEHSGSDPCTPKFIIDYQEAVAWQLHFLVTEDGKCMILFGRQDALNIQVIYHYNFKIISSDRQDVMSENKKRLFVSERWELDKRESWIFPLSIQNILENRNKYLPDDCLTVQITMWRDSLKKFDVSRIIASTDFNYQHKFSFVWELKNFSTSFEEEKIICLKSLTFKLKLISNNKKVSLFINQIEYIDYETCVKLKLCLSNCNQYKREIKVQTLMFSEKQGHYEFLSLLENFTSEVKEFLIEDVLSLYLEFQEENTCSTIMKYEFENSVEL